MKYKIGFLFIFFVIGIISTGCNSCPHINSELISDTATCTHEGIATYHCNECNSTYTKNSPLKNHIYIIKISDTATCTSGGIKTLKCANCDAKKTETSSSLGHDYSDYNCLCRRCYKPNSSCNTHEMTSSYSCRHEKDIYNSEKTLYCGTLTCTFTISPSSTSISLSAVFMIAYEGVYYFTLCLYDSDGDRICSGGISATYISSFIKTITGTLSLEHQISLGSKFYTEVTVFGII